MNKFSGLIAGILVFLIFLTSSFDVFLNLRIGGFSFRIIYLFNLFLLGFYFLLNPSFFFRFKFPAFFVCAAWFVLLVLFVGNSSLVSRNIGYTFWLCMDLLVVFAIVSLRRFIKIDLLLNLYLISFLVLSVVGFIQFILGTFGISFFTSQWFLPKWPRLNGFSYEPSYYSSYLLIGCVTSFFLVMQKIKTTHFVAQLTLLTTSSAIILSTSRIGIVILFFLVFGYSCIKIFTSLMKFKLSKIHSLLVVLFLFAAISCIVYLRTTPAFSNMLLSGTGTLSHSSHSTQTRMNSFQNVVDLFIESPLIGYGIGGIAPAIAERKGVRVFNNDDVKAFEGTNVFAEVLAASGIVGFVFFLLFLKKYVYNLFQIGRRLRNTNIHYSTIIYSLCFAFVAESIILMFNGTILRPYFWIHIGLLGYCRYNVNV